MTLDASVAVRRDTSSSTHDPSAAAPAPASPSDVFTTVGFIGRAPVMLRLRADVLRYARSNAPVLVTGETGSGKELVARALHAASPRARHPFVAVNVATLRSDLTSSELFGHERGAFTGAVVRRRGVFEQAHGGTLLLDEVGELDLRIQTDLLRVLETGEIRPLGSERARIVDVRVIAATHRDLSSMVTAGSFREDLYYRLNVLPLTTPSLRQHRGDLPALVHHLLERLRPEVGDRRLSNDALALLASHPWPGNIRQLLNVLRRALVRDERLVLDAEAIANALAAEPGATAPVLYRAAVVRDLSAATVAEAMHASGGSISGAARQLGVARSTLRERVGAYRAERARPVPEVVGP
jgi:DNA-binding NtrC family response regulator